MTWKINKQFLTALAVCAVIAGCATSPSEPLSVPVIPEPESDAPSTPENDPSDTGDNDTDASDPAPAPSDPARTPKGKERAGQETFGGADGRASCLQSRGYANGVYDCVEVLYGTNRKPVRGNLQISYGPDADDDLHLGLLSITIPTKRNALPQKGEKIPTLKPSQRFVSDVDREEFFTIWGNDRLSDNEFALFANFYAQQAKDFEKQAIVYIHGFNVTFRSAAFRAAQLKFDSGFDGPMFMYSWPANGNVNSYLTDMDDADLSVDHVVTYLRRVISSVEPSGAKLHLIAHSMGSRVLAQALAKLSEDPNIAAAKPFSLIVFASADLDEALFQHWVGKAEGLADKITIYASESDRALKASRWLRAMGSLGLKIEDKPRVGLISKPGRPSVFSFADTIDVTSVPKLPWGRWFGVNHSDYAENEVIIDDLISQFRSQETAPTSRNANFAEQCISGRRFWKFFTSRAQADRRRQRCVASGPDAAPIPAALN